jgi:uncharacterized membrane protein YfhO
MPAAIDCQPNERPTVRVISYETNRVVLETQGTCTSVLVSSEVMYPGWTAYIDNQKASIIEGNAAFRTLPVPKGKHNIVMQYEPWIFLYGGIVTLAAFGLLVGIFRFSYGHK